MKARWEIKKLGEVCNLVGGGTPSKANSSYYSGDILWATVRDMRADYLGETDCKISSEAIKNSATNIIPKGNVIIATRVGLGKVCLLEKDSAINQDLKGIIPKKEGTIDSKFLFYWFKSVGKVIIENGTGATVQGVKIPFIAGLPIPTPPISEQKRIAAVLDEAFSAIAKAKENTEKNLANAHELYDAFLNVGTTNKESLGNLVDIRTGKLDANAAKKDGEYPFFTCSREVYSIDKYAFDCEAILLAGNNAIGDFNVKHYQGKFNAYQRTYVITVNDNPRVLYRYLYFQMLKSLKEFKQKSVGAGTKFLKLDMIKDLQIDLPTVVEQKNIVAKLDRVSSETKRLENIYSAKLANLEEFKKTILQKAFSGNLSGLNHE